MSRLIRVSFLALALVCATGAFANVPSPELSNVPGAIVMSPGLKFTDNSVGTFIVDVEGPLGAVNGAFVEVEISPEAEALVGWCVEQTETALLTGFTDANGEVEFSFYGGGCLDPDDIFFGSFIAQVRADGIVLGEPFMNSPDAVDSNGDKATDEPPTGGQRRCDTVGGVEVAIVSLADAVYHTRPIKLGLRDQCTQFEPPFNNEVEVGDAVLLTPYVKASRSCNCQ